ncbi:MAG: FMN-binding protein [bacterium]
MPPKDHPTTSHLVALGTAAVLAVYGVGFVRTQAAAARLDGEKPRRRPPAPVAVAQHSADVSISAPATAEAITKGAPAAGQALKVKPEPKGDAASAMSGAERPKITALASAIGDTATKAPADTTRTFPDLKDGVYTGWGTSRHGDIEARVEIRNGRIFSASIAQCLTMYSVYWIAALPPQVVKRQSPEVDFISGATESTNAFYDGVVEALKKAK